MSLQSPLSRPADYSVPRSAVRWTMRLRIAAAVVAVAALCAGGRAAAQQATLRVLGSNGVKAAFEQLQADSERHVGRSIAVTFGTSASTKQRITGGEAFDVAILTSDVIDELTKAGKIAPASRQVLGRSGIGIGVRAKAAKPDIRTADALKRTLVNARSMTWASDGASRPHIARMIETLGIADAVKSKVILEEGSVRAASRVASGDVELIITLISEIAPVPGLDLVGPLPAEFQNYVSFAAGIGSAAHDAEAGRALIAFLAGPGASAAFTSKGIDR